MIHNSRRSFLKNTAIAGTALPPIAGWAESANAQSASGPARVYVDPAQKIASLDRKVFGSFIEHLGRSVYEGIYEPGSRLADANGFRKDVLEEVKKMGVPIIRYPGGNFVSGYNWLDGVGPKDKRPVVLDKAWNTIEPNQFGTNEFMQWCRLVGSEPLMGLNLGTGTPEMAAALVEYCNQESGTKWSELRRQHGIEKPHNVKYWCLGNEMDGPWQIGHMPAREYGLKARDCANQMRMVDPSLQLIACGSSSPGMPTYLEWDRQVLEECYDMVDGLSLHCYYRNDDQETGAAGDTAKFLSFNLEMEEQISEIAGVCDYVKARKRSPKKLWLSFDEWNVWYRHREGDGGRKRAPHLAGGSLQPGGCAAGRRFLQFADAPCGPRADRLPGAAGQCDCADYDQSRMASSARQSIIPTHGRFNARAERCSILRWSLRHMKSKARADSISGCCCYNGWQNLFAVYSESGSG